MKMMGLGTLMFKSIVNNYLYDTYSYNSHLYLYNSLPDLAELTNISDHIQQHLDLWPSSVGMVSAQLFIENTDKLRLKIRNGPHALTRDRNPSMLANPNQPIWNYNTASIQTYGDLAENVYIHKVNNISSAYGSAGDTGTPTAASLPFVNRELDSLSTTYNLNLFSGVAAKTRNTGLNYAYAHMDFSNFSRRGTVKSSFEALLPTNRIITNITSQGTNPTTVTKATSHLNYFNSTGVEVASGALWTLREIPNPNRHAPGVATIGSSVEARGFRITSSFQTRDPEIIWRMQMLSGAHVGDHVDLIKPDLLPSYGILRLMPNSNKLNNQEQPLYILIELGDIGSGAELEIYTKNGYIPYNCIQETTLLEI